MNLKLKNFTPIEVALRSASEYDDNGCALIALSSAFKVDYNTIMKLFELEGRKRHEGSTNDQVKKVIKVLAAFKEKQVKYHSLKNNPSLTKFYNEHKTGLYLLNQKNHISCLKNGVFVDDYLFYAKRYPSIYHDTISSHLRIVGYWEITHPLGFV